MINPSLLTDSLASDMAEQAIISLCEEGAIKHVNDVLQKSIILPFEYIQELRRIRYFDVLFKSLEPYERQFTKMLRGIWDEERRIVISNLKKMKKSWLTKDKVDEILYPRKRFEVKLAKETKAIDERIMEARGNEELRKIEQELRKPRKAPQVEPLGIAFDVQNPEVQKWLNDYTPQFSKKLETVSTDKLRRELTAGIKAGEGIPKLTERVNGTYANWNEVRSEAIARSETIRASNKGALESYRQSGVVKKKIWVTHLDHRTCASCRRLDGKTIDLEKNYFNKGEAPEVITVDGKKQSFSNDYTDIDAPPRHTKCRCSIAAYMEDIAPAPAPPIRPRPEVGRGRPWKPFKNLKEAEKWGEQYGIESVVAKGRKLTIKEWNIVGKEMGKLPDDLLRKIKTSGGKMDLVVDSGITVHPAFKHLKGQTPRGWTSGSWDNVPGAGGTRAVPKTVIVANKTGVGHGSTNLILHEYGHTVDAIYKKGWTNLSESTKWQNVWKSNTKKGLIRSPYEVTYAEEYWAESFAEYFSTPGHGYLPKNVVTYFKNTFGGG